MKKKIFAAAMTAALFLALSCTKDNENKTPMLPSGYVGTFEVGTESGQPYTLENIKAKYVIIGEKMTVTLEKVSFSPKMPVTIDMTIPSIDAVLSGGTYTLSKASVIPMVGDVEFEKYKISNLTGMVNDGVMSLSMTILGFPVTYKGQGVEP